MKAVNKLAVLLSLGSLLTLAASAKTLEQTYLESYRGAPGAPVPVAVVSPRVGPEYAGSTVELEFNVDTDGQTSDFRVKSSPDSMLGEAVLAAVKQWQFAPAERNGVPVTTRVVLPVHIVDDSAAGARYAAN